MNGDGETLTLIPVEGHFTGIWKPASENDRYLLMHIQNADPERRATLQQPCWLSRLAECCNILGIRLVLEPRPGKIGRPPLPRIGARVGDGRIDSTRQA